jgi:hypothetical protein
MIISNTSNANAGANRPRLLGGWADRLEVLLPLLTYALVTLTGASTSSIGISLLRGAKPLGHMFGTPLLIRSDEYLTAAPIEIGVLAHGNAVFSPLANGPDLIYQISSGGFFETILFLEGNLLRLGPWLPDPMLFAAFRALPFLLVALFLPPLLRRFGASRPLSWLGVVLALCAPAALWWSFMPIRVLAFAVTGSYLLILARDRFVRRSWWLGVIWAVLAGGAIARLGTYYVPWGLTMGIPLVAATAAFLLADKPRWKIGFGTLGLSAAVSIILYVGTLVENRSALKAELSTVYPGMRRSTGTARGAGELFGSPGVYWMKGLKDPIILNRSELATAFTITAVWALLLWLHRRGNLTRPVTWVTGVLAGFTVLWLSWVMVDWGSVGAHIPVLSLVLDRRSAQTVGFLGAILICLVLSQLTRERRWQIAIVAALGCTMLTAYGVSRLQIDALPDLTTPQVWVSAAVTGVVVLVLTRWPDHWAPTTALAVSLGLIALTVNPIILGLGDLRDSQPAEQVRQFAAEARSDGGLIATDNPSVTSLLAANAAPTLTGFQVTGPVREKWKLLDPEGQYETEWNRGASYIRRSVKDGLSAPTVSNPNKDIIEITADPCELTQRMKLSFILSSVPQHGECLTPETKFKWGGQMVHSYRVVATD